VTLNGAPPVEARGPLAGAHTMVHS
jgi:hypothetical protein